MVLIRIVATIDKETKILDEIEESVQRIPDVKHLSKARECVG